MMFRQRLLTVLILVPLVLLSLYYAKPIFLQWVVGALAVAMGWEWMQLVPIKKPIGKFIFILALLALIIPCFFWVPYWLAAILVLWIFILVAVVAFPASQAYWGFPAIVSAACFLIVPSFVVIFDLIIERHMGRDLFVYLLLIVWATDIGAYLAGKQWGRHKLIPHVSPGKTIEGGLGGFLLAMLVALAGYFYFKPSCLWSWFGVAIATVLISMLGDLFISMLKRRSHIKDTGTIFPGHGGVLDRLDSLLAALPIFYCGLYFIFPNG